MKRALIWFFLSCKRYLKQPVFLLLLLVLPFAALLAGGSLGNSSGQIRIALYTDGKAEDSLEVQLIEKLSGQGSRDGMFSFYQCENEQQLKEDVAAKRAECGYVIGEDLREKLNQGEKKRLITVWSAPSTVTASLSTETVFAALMELYGRELTKGYAMSGEAFSALGKPGTERRAEVSDKAGILYDKWMEQGGTFQFQYVYQTTGESGSEALAPSVFPVRGIGAVAVFAAGLYSAVVLMRDEKRGLFVRLGYRQKLPCRLASLTAPVALMALSALLALYAGGEAAGVLREGAAMLLYGVAVLAMAWVLKLLLPSPDLLCCLIPFFLLGSLIFCPVFLDIGALVPELEVMGKLFLPYYYLR